MSSPNLTILRTYQFLAEAFFFYVLLVPFYYFREIPLPMWSYLVAVLGTTLFLTIFTRITDTYFPILIYAPIAVFCFVGMGYDLILAIIIAGFFSWRFIRHLQEEGMDHETRLMGMGLFVVLIECLLIQSFALYFMVSLMVATLILGHLLSHVVSIKISNSSKKPFPQAAVIAGLFSVLTGIAYTAYEGLERIWNGLLSIVAGGFSLGILGFINLLEFMGIKFTGLEAISEKVENNREGMLNFSEMERPKSDEVADPAVADKAGDTIYWGFLSVLIIIGLIIGIILLKKKVLNKIGDPQDDEASATSKWGDSGQGRLRDKLSKFFNRKPDNQIRQMFFDFERFSQKKGFGRKNYETIEDWFERLDVKGVDVEVYQKVRYGDEPSLTEQEVERFKHDLHQLRQALLAKVKEEKDE